MFKRSITANFSRLRVNAHSLMIEKGRHFRKKIPIENRLCTLYNLNETEDEAHFMLRCTNYSNIREKMFSDISDIYADFDNLDDNDKFVLLMGVKDYDCILPIILSTLPSSNVQMWIKVLYICKSSRNTVFVVLTVPTYLVMSIY